MKQNIKYQQVYGVVYALINCAVCVHSDFATKVHTSPGLRVASTSISEAASFDRSFVPTPDRCQYTDERWSWGYVDTAPPPLCPYKTARPPVTTARPSDQYFASDIRVQDRPAEEDPCAAYNPTAPAFAAPGRRLSDIKCYEYIWGIKVRDDIERRQKECTKKRREEGTVGIAAIGGRDTRRGEFPHMGAIGWKPAGGKAGWIFKCGGSLISDKFVLTAAHCTQVSDLDSTVEDPSPKIVRLGDKNIIDSFSNGALPTDGVIARAIRHPEYRAPKKYHDIALFELSARVDFTALIQPACLWPQMDTRSLGTRATLTGWGVVETAGRKTSPELQAATVDLIDQDRCDDLLRPFWNRKWSGLADHQVCGGELKGGVDACQVGSTDWLGDSGGPLQVRIKLPPASNGSIHYVVGVTSFGVGCARPNVPGVYTRVAAFIDWIESVAFDSA